MADRATLKYAYRLAAVVIVAANRWIDGTMPGPALDWHRQARRQAGRLMIAADPDDALRRYERGLMAWRYRFEGLANG